MEQKGNNYPVKQNGLELYQSHSMDSAVFVDQAIQSILKRVDNGIQMIAIQQKLQPFLLARTMLEIQMLICSNNMKPDQRTDDQYLDEDQEPWSIDVDTLQSQNRPQVDFGPGKTYTVEYIRNSKKQGELERLVKAEQEILLNKTQGRDRSLTIKMSTSMKKMLQQKLSTTKKLSQKDLVALTQESEKEESKPKQLAIEPQLNEEELKQVDYLRDLINRKKFQYVRNDETQKHQKVLMTDSMVNTTNTGFQGQDKEKQNIIKNQNYTYDQNGNILIVKKVNPNTTAAAKKDMQPNQNFALPKLAEAKLFHQKNQSQTNSSVQDPDILPNENNLIEMLEHQMRQQNQVIFEPNKLDSHLNASELIQADNGVTLRDDQGKVLTKGQNFSSLEFQGKKKMNMTMYRSQFKNNFNVNLSHLRSSRDKSYDQVSEVQIATAEKIGIPLDDDLGDPDFIKYRNSSSKQSRARKIVTRQGKIQVNLMNQEIQSLLSNQRNVTFIADGSLDASFSGSNQNRLLSQSFLGTFYGAPEQSSAQRNFKKRNKTFGRISGMGKEQIHLYNQPSNFDSRNLQNSQKTVHQIFNLSLIGKLNDHKELDEIQKLSSQIRNTVTNGSRTENFKTSTQIHREQLKTQNGQSRYNNLAFSRNSKRLASIRNKFENTNTLKMTNNLSMPL